MTRTRPRTVIKTNPDRCVLVVTQRDDVTADLVISDLHSRGIRVVRFDSADFPDELSVTAQIGAGQGLSGVLRTPTRIAKLGEVRSLYYRRPSSFAFPGLSGQDTRFAITQARYGLGGIIASLPGCLYLNHPHAIADAEFKPSQLAVAYSLGFELPCTLITNEPDKVRDFISAQKRVIYKPLRTTDYQVAGKAATLWAQEVLAEQIDDTIAGTMHLFQRLVEKKYDLRVTVVGDKVFAVRIDSPLLDWRADYDQANYRVTPVPSNLSEKMRAYLNRFGLLSGCFDFAVGLNGRENFLECNPNGQWGWLQEATGLPIAAAFADLLERGRP